MVSNQGGYEKGGVDGSIDAIAGEPWLGRSSVVVSSRKAEGPLVVWIRLMGG